MGPPREHGGMHPAGAKRAHDAHLLQWGRRVNTAEWGLELYRVRVAAHGFNGAAACARLQRSYPPVCAEVDHPERTELGWAERKRRECRIFETEFIKSPLRGPSLQWSSSERSDAHVGFLALAKRSLYEPPLRTTRWLG